MEHRGEILNQALKEVGMKKAALASRLGKTPTTISNWIAKPDLSDALMLEIGNEIHFDFSQKIPALKRILEAANQAAIEEPIALYMLQHPATASMPNTLSACQQALFEMQQRFLDLQSQHIKVLSKLARVA